VKRLSTALALLFAAAPGLFGQEQKVEFPLRLEDVLQSVERNYPPLLAALQEGELAEADVLFALGRFDLTFRARFDNDSFNYYPNRRFDTMVEQPFETQGMSLFGGYRLGEGSFASYDGRLQTRDRGEWRSGIRVPLFRDRAIDGRRADLRKAELGRAVARMSIDQQKIVVLQAATRRYWDWVVSGRRFQITKSILDIALQRDRFLREQVDAGALPQFEVADNDRIILQRRSAMVEADRAIQQSAIELSLYYRDPAGNPIVPRAEQTPNEITASQDLDPTRLDEDIAAAIERRPEVRRLDAQREQNQVDMRLARNLRLPAIDFSAGFAQEHGDIRNPVSRIATNELKTAITFELPFQRRSATGRLRAAEARERQFEQRDRFLRDQIRAEVQDAYSAFLAAQERARLLRLEVDATRNVEEAERVRFELGEGTLFVLNLREQQTADAALREAAALADAQRAYAVYELAIAAALR
jgi:outer membrane protein, heavy metal efflux system